MENKYIVISPVRNEENNIELTIQSMVNQTIKPFKWIIVDDGSTDRTAEIIQKYSNSTEWIILIRLPDRGYYDLHSGGEIKAFLKGFDTVVHEDWDFVAKLDGDISFNTNYFQNLFMEFKNDDKLGVASGACYYDFGDKVVLESAYDKQPRGAARLYRRECWNDIEGVVDELAWDVLDIYRCRMLGWNTHAFENIKMIHHVKTGTKGGILRGSSRQGRVAFLIGTHPVFFSAKVLREMLQKPYILKSLSYTYGYLKCFVIRENRLADKDLLSFIRREQIDRLKKMF